MKHIFTRLLSILFLCAISISATAQEAYAVMSKDCTTLTFYYDSKKASREGTAYELNPGENRPELEKTKDRIILYINDNDNFTTVVFDGSFKDARPISCAHWFSGFKNLKKIEGIENLNTSNVTDMSCMFMRCESLTSLDVSNFNTSNVTDMYRMFDNCANLKTIYAGAGWIIGKDTDSEGMFWNSTKLVGGKGTIFSPDATDASRAKIDGGKANPGYFTAKK
jgi:surface protein